MDLRKLTLKQLQKLQKDVDKAIKSHEGKARKQALSELAAKAKQLGFSLSDLVDEVKPVAKSSKPARASKGAKVPPKYAHLTDKALTWTGRGKKPKWIEEQVSAGVELDSLLIK